MLKWKSGGTLVYLVTKIMREKTQNLKIQVLGCCKFQQIINLYWCGTIINWSHTMNSWRNKRWSRKCHKIPIQENQRKRKSKTCISGGRILSVVPQCNIGVGFHGEGRFFCRYIHPESRRDLGDGVFRLDGKGIEWEAGDEGWLYIIYPV